MAEQLKILETCQKQDDKSDIKKDIDVSDETTYGEKNSEEGDSQENSFSNTIKRYSKYDLLSLRNGQLSINYPNCALRTDLQTLSIWTYRLRCKLQYLFLWKIPSTGTSYGNCNCNCNGICQSYACGESQSYLSTSSQVNAINPQICYGSVQQTQQLQPLQTATNSSPTLGSKRAVRSRERSLNYQRCINTELIRATSPSVSGSVEGSIQQHLNHQIKPALIDHRSISSSHLMPAFAKRRMGHTNNVLNFQSEPNFNKHSGQNTDDISNDDDGIEMSSKSRKDSAKTSSNQNDYHIYKSSVNSRLDKSDQSMECQAGWMNLVKKPNTDYSPSNNKSNNAGSANKKLTYERRIGSGRLVPREVNWDMRTVANKQIDKDNSMHSNITSNNSVEKEKNSIEEVEKPNNRNISLSRYSDTRTQERRSFDRRMLNTDDNGANHSSTNKRYTTTVLGDERNNYDASYHQQTQPFTGQRSMSFRRREYVEHKDHHRDFRDFREPKDSRENREQRGDHHHNHHRDHKEEPEWFSEGPTSQHDTIELRGFEEIDDSQQQQPEQSFSDQNSKIERKISESSLLSHTSGSNVNLSTKEIFDISTEVSNNSNNVTNTFDIEVDTSSSCNNVKGKETPNKEITDSKETITNPQQISSNPEEFKNSDNPRCNVTELFFDNFLNIEALENSLIGSANGQPVPATNENGGGTSRFSRWFFNNSNNNLNSNEVVSNNPPTKDDSKQLNNDMNESDFNSFMTFLKCNNFPTPELPKGLPSNVSALSVEELEARMRKIDSGESDKTNGDEVNKNVHKNENPQTKRPECEAESDATPQNAEVNSQDIEAFRKLLDQLGKPRVDISMNIILPSTAGQGHLLHNPVNVYPPHTGISPLPPNALPQSNMTKQEYMMKIIHQQQLLHHQQNMGKMITPLLQQHHPQNRITQLSPQQQTETLPLIPLPHHYHSHHMPMMMGHQQKRLDIQHLIQSVVRGELSRSFLEKELKNPSIPSYTKEIISTVLKETSRYNPPAVSNQTSSDSVKGASSNDISAAPGNLMQSFARGEVSLNLLEHELNKLNNMGIPTDPSNNGVAFKERSRCATPMTTSGGGVLVPLPPQVASAQKQNSVLTNENVCNASSDKHQQQAISSMLRTHAHEDSTIHMPTQRELQMHTQAIMQNALFKKKLEVEQHEVLIKRRQEIQKQQELEASTISQHHQLQQPNSSNLSLPHQFHQHTSRHMNSPTPLAFTPTSVLRKMTAEKETISNSSQATTISSSSPQQIQPYLQQAHLKIPSHVQIHGQQISYQHSNQPRMILGGGNFQYMHQQHQIAPAANGSPQISPQQKSQLRNQPQPAPLKWPLITPHSSMESNHSLLNNMNNKPMGRPILKGPGPIQPLIPQNANSPIGHNQTNINQNSQTASQMQKYQSIPQQPRQIVGQQFSAHIIQQQNNIQQQLLQQQRSVIMQRQQIQPNDMGNHAPLQPPAHHPACNDSNSVTNLNYQRDGRLSPTSNQLAQWFSPELLAQASAGKLPLLNMNQALSLEEFEKSIQHSSTAVNN